MIKEKDIVKNIKAGLPVPMMISNLVLDNGTVVVKLEGYIQGKQADLTRQIIETDASDPLYKELFEDLVKSEEKNGFIYDVSPSYMRA